MDRPTPYNYISLIQCHRFSKQDYNLEQRKQRLQILEKYADHSIKDSRRVVPYFPRSLAQGLSINDVIIFQRGRGHSRSQQRTHQRVLVLTLKFLALKKTGFSPVKNTSQDFFDFLLPLFYATFQCGHYNIFKKILNLFFAHENIRKRASKVAHNRSQTFFHRTARLPKPAQN